MPPIPDHFSFTDEIVFKNYRSAATDRIAYSNKLKAVRIDLLSGKNMAPAFVAGPYKHIHDFNSGNKFF